MSAVTGITDIEIDSSRFYEFLIVLRNVCSRVSSLVNADKFRSSWEVTYIVENDGIKCWIQRNLYGY